MRTLIVDDHTLFSEGLRLLLGATPEFEHIDCCASGRAALQLADEQRYDLVLLDWHLGSPPSDTELIQRLKAVQPEARVVIVSGECEPGRVRRAIESGAVGYVPKESSPALLIDALTITAHGGIFLPAAVLVPQRAAESRSTHGLLDIAEAFPALTERQVQVLGLLVRGLQNKQIARALDIAEGTVKQHLNAIFQELGVQTRTEAVYLLSRRGVRLV